VIKAKKEIGPLAIIWLIGIYEIILGVLLMIHAFWFQSLGHKLEREMIGGD